MSDRRREQRWRATLAGGVVVLAAVTGLLEALRRSVRTVERRVEAVWVAGKQLAAVTQISHLVSETRRHTGALEAAIDGGGLDEER